MTNESQSIERAFRGRTVALCVTGSIAAYKSVEVARACIKAGARVLPVMSASAKRFLGPITLSGICGEPVREDMWDPSFSGEMHVVLSERADLVVIVPATADVLARLAAGRGDDLTTALALCARGPLLVAPAMHPRMWAHAATRRNVALLASQSVTFVGPVVGPVASGEEGMGRMAEPLAIVEAMAKVLLEANDSSPRTRRLAIVNRPQDGSGEGVPLSESGRDLQGRRVVVTAGPTVEDIDPVRFLGNRSSGKMGYALAERAAARGAEVTLISGPVHLAAPAGVTLVQVRGALEMRDAVLRAAGDDLAQVDAVIMAAAVADYRPRSVSSAKIKKGGDETQIHLVRNPDILAELGKARRGRRTPCLVGFAVETGSDAEVVGHARSKLGKKGVDLVVANHASTAFGGDENRGILVGASSEEPLPSMTKHALADRILDQVSRAWLNGNA